MQNLLTGNTAGSFLDLLRSHFISTTASTAKVFHCDLFADDTAFCVTQNLVPLKNTANDEMHTYDGWAMTNTRRTQCKLLVKRL